MKFSDLKLHKKILENLEKYGYKTPTLIQEKVIPLTESGKDIFGCAQTGTGKTASFALPLINKLAIEKEKSQNNIRHIKFIILSPTRELAMQIFENFKKYSSGLNQRFVCIYGGFPKRKQIDQIKNGVDIAICTPGRLLDIIQSGRVIDLSHVETIVLDEADIMLDMGFIDDVNRIINKLPKDHQTLFFSATMPKSIKSLVDKIMKPDYENIIVSPPSTTLDSIEQLAYCVNREDKRNLLLYLIKENNVKSSIIFTRTKIETDSLNRFLKTSGLISNSIHGDKEQRQRDRIIRDFKDGKIKILVATDVASRGIHVDNISHIFNYDLPDSSDTYVHRIGRTGRANTKGVAISLFTKNEKLKIANIQKSINKIIDTKLVDFNNKIFTPLHISNENSKDAFNKRSNNRNSRNRNNSFNKKNENYKNKRNNSNSYKDNNSKDSNYKKDNNRNFSNYKKDNRGSNSYKKYNNEKNK